MQVFLRLIFHLIISYLKRLEVNRAVPDMDANSIFLFSNNLELNKVTDWQFNARLRNAKIIKSKADVFIAIVDFLELAKENTRMQILFAFQPYKSWHILICLEK